MTSRSDLVVATSWGNPLMETFLAHIEEELQREQSLILGETRIVFDFQDIF